MSTKHTPGPWNVKYSKFSIIETQEGAQVAECKNLTGLVNLQANARLIAAAPELLMALQLALPALKYLRKQFPRSEHDDSIDALAVSKAAIAKATGEAQ